jgi:conjugal transfer pilus assembly protein TraB
MASLKLKLWDTLDPKRKQWVLLILLLGAAFTILWAIFALTEKPKPSLAQGAGAAGQQRVTNVGVMAPGQQVNPLDSWLGGAGKDVAQLKQDRDAMLKEKDDQKAFNRDILTKFEQLQQKITQAPPAAAPPAPAPLAVSPGVPSSTSPANLPPPATARSVTQGTAFPPGFPPGLVDSPSLGLTRVSLRDATRTAAQAAAPGRAPATVSGGSASEPNESQVKTLDNYIPISFTRAVLLGGLDAPTGGQAQSNPHPVLLRLDDNAILPNRFRAQVRECFVIGAGYGDISSERAYIRTERLACVRHGGSALEVKIKGSIFDETGKVGVRGRLVTKQGQVLANALLAGVISGIGYGFQNQFTTFSTSPFGQVATTDPSKAFEAGMSAGVGRAMDRLAQYYISLAEKTFPVIEVDAGRSVDVVLTEGVVLDAPLTSAGAAGPTSDAVRSRVPRYKQVADDAED